MKPKICVSFNYTEDKRYYYLMQAWNNNSNFTFVFTDRTPSEIQSNNISTIKSVLTKKINDSDYLLAIVGKSINSLHPDYRQIGYRNWQCFEIEKAKELHKKIIAIKIDSSIISPDCLLNSNVSWARSFSEEAIINAIRNV